MYACSAPPLRRDPLLDLLDLLARSLSCFLEPLELTIDEGGGDPESQVACGALEDQRLADADAGRYAESGQAHDTSSKPRSTSAVSAVERLSLVRAVGRERDQAALRRAAAGAGP